MFRTVAAHQYIKSMSSGKTRPCLLTCAEINANDGHAAEEDEDIEVIVKFSAGCERGVKGLIAEVLASSLAVDLELPVPEPFLVFLEPEFIQVIPDVTIRKIAEKSAPWACGSRLLPGQFSTLSTTFSFDQEQATVAADILAFDIMIANPDRRLKNPNCLSNGKRLAIIDHELAFMTEGILFWVPPWEDGAISFGSTEDAHVFLETARERRPDFGRLRLAFDAIPNSRIMEYFEQLPEAWLLESGAATGMRTYIQDLRANCAQAIDRIVLALR